MAINPLGQSQGAQGHKKVAIQQAQPDNQVQPFEVEVVYDTKTGKTTVHGRQTWLPV